MSMYEWAENECRIACKRENPNYDFDSDEFDYGCSCYKSALKAYKSLCEDNHSGASFAFTKGILVSLMDEHPLTPITDEDFFISRENDEISMLENDSWLESRGIKSEIQCPRMYSLFRIESIDGIVEYTDTDRAYFVDVEYPSQTYNSNADFLDEMFPITMPYMPKRGKYKIYTQTFLTDKRHGDFDTSGILYVVTPDNEKIDIGIYKTEDENGQMRNITKEEYDELLKKRIDPVSKKAANHILWTLLSNSSDEDTCSKRERGYNALVETRQDFLTHKLIRLCLFFDKPENWKYNTLGMYQALCRGEIEKYKDVPELMEISEHLKDILNEIA